MSTVTWIASEAGVASDGANWSGGIAPQTGDDVIFDATSVNNCLWDLDASIVTVNSFTLATGYTGTVTQGDVDIGIGAGGYLQEDGTFTGNAAKAIYCAGDFIRKSGLITIETVNLIMVGNDTTFENTNYRLRTFENIGGVTLKSSLQTRSFINEGLLNVPGPEYIEVSLYYGYSIFENTGDILGSGEIRVYGYNSAHELIIGQISVPIKLCGRTLATENIIFSLVNDEVLYGAMSVISEHATYTCTLDLNGHSLTADSITVGMRGAIVGDGTIINHGDLDASAGSFSFIGQYVQAGDGTIKLAEGQKFNELLCIAPTKLASDIIVDDILAYVHPIDKGAFNITNDRTKEYTGPRRPFMMPLKRRRLSNPSYHSLMEFIWYD